MPKPKVTIVDYGVGNILSIRRAIEKAGSETIVERDPQKIAIADRLILPGVGAFGHATRELQNHELREPVIEFARSGKPLLGICVGMQMLFDRSHEMGEHVGLGLIPGEVKRIPVSSVTGEPVKIPHIGWAPLMTNNESKWKTSMLSKIQPGAWCYFVHSFVANADERQHLIAHTEYSSHKLTAFVERDNIAGCQFHPEKSGPTGLSIMESFCAV